MKNNSFFTEYICEYINRKEKLDAAGKSFFQWFEPMLMKKDKELLKNLRKGDFSKKTKNKLESQVQQFIENDKYHLEMAKWEGVVNANLNEVKHIADQLGLNSFNQSSSQTINNSGPIEQQINIKENHGPIYFQSSKKNTKNAKSNQLSKNIQSVKAKIALGETLEAISILQTYLETIDSKFVDEVYLIAGRWNRLSREINANLINNEHGKIEQAKINNSLMALLKRVGES